MGKPSPSPPRPLPQAQDMVTTPKKPKLTTKGPPPQPSLPPKEKRRPRPLKDPYISQQSNFKVSSYFIVLMATDEGDTRYRNSCIALMSFF